MNVLRYLPRFRHLDQQLRVYADRESWSRADVESYQLERLNQVWSHAQKHVAYYHKLTAELPPRFGSLKEYSALMPLLPKRRVRDQPQEFFSNQHQAGRWYRSGGSTGSPTAIFWEWEAHREVLRAKYRCEQAHGLDVFDPKAFLWGRSGSFAPGWKGHLDRLLSPIQDKLRGRKRLSAYDLGPEKLQALLPEIQAYGARSLYGYSSAVYLLADAAYEHDYHFPSLTLAIMTAEPADASMRQHVEQRLGCRAVTEYGATECDLIAYTMPDSTLRTRDDVVFVETLANAHGTYDIVLSVLTNSSFPLLRYCIEDTTASAQKISACGFSVLDEIRGRSNDILVGRAGSLIHPMIVKHTMEHLTSIRRFQAHQQKTGELLLTIECCAELPEKQLALVSERLQDILEGFPVQTRIVDVIPGNLAGKHRWVLSDRVTAQPVTPS